MARFGRLLGLTLALAGFAAARVLVPDGQAQVPPVPTVTVTVPTVPVPAPVPSTPTPTVTVAPPPLPTPTVSTPTVTTPPRAPAPPPPPVRIVPPAPPATTAPRVTVPPTTTDRAPVPSVAATTAATRTTPRPATSPAAPAQPSGGSSSGWTGYAPVGTTSGSGDSRAASRPSGPTRSQELAARVHRTKTRVSVRLRFALPAARKLFLVVRGPAPSCSVAGVIPLRGRRGENTVFFAGRVHGHRLDPGLYRLSLSPTRRAQPGAPVTVVRVVSARRSVPVARPKGLPACPAAATTSSLDGTTRVLVGEPRDEQRPTAAVASVPGGTKPLQVGGTAAGGDDEGIAGGFLPNPVGGDSADGGLESFAAVAVLVLVASLLFGMVARVARFLRGSWNP